MSKPSAITLLLMSIIREHRNPGNFTSGFLFSRERDGILKLPGFPMKMDISVLYDK